VLAVKFSRTNRALVEGNVIVTVLPVEGLKVYPADPTIVVNVDPSVLPWTDSVWVRVLHDVAGGRSSTIRLKLLAAPPVGLETVTVWAALVEPVATEPKLSAPGLAVTPDAG
jgi:hypothetical protein